MTTLYDIIKAIQNAPAKGGFKQAILEQHKDNTLLQQYLKAVYDPRINYYTKKLPQASVGNIATLDSEFINWMIINLASRALSGKKAQEALKGNLSAMDVEGQELVGYIIKRDIQAGIAEGTILKVFPGLFYIPPYHRCASMTEKVQDKFAALPYFFVQTKSDGQFSYLIKRPKEAPEAMTRAGSIHPSWLSEKLAIGLPEGVVLAGELLVYENVEINHGEYELRLLNRQTGNGILNAILKGDEKGKFNPDTMEVQYVAWDMLTIAEFDAGVSTREYDERLGVLHDMLDAVDIPSVRIVRNWLVRSLAEANKIQREHLARGEEGTVRKNPNMGWRDCSSGDPDMPKVKLVFEADYEIESVFEGEGKYAGKAGGFRMKSSDGLIKFNVGTGFSDKDREVFWDVRDSLRGKVCAIEGNDIVTSKGKDTESVFLPVLIEVRYDKKVADSRERVWEQLNAAKLGSKED